MPCTPYTTGRTCSSVSLSLAGLAIQRLPLKVAAALRSISDVASPRSTSPVLCNILASAARQDTEDRSIRRESLGGVRHPPFFWLVWQHFPGTPVCIKSPPAGDGATAVASLLGRLTLAPVPREGAVTVSARPGRSLEVVPTI